PWRAQNGQIDRRRRMGGSRGADDVEGNRQIRDRVGARREQTHLADAVERHHSAEPAGVPRPLERADTVPEIQLDALDRGTGRIRDGKQHAVLEDVERTAREVELRQVAEAAVAVERDVALARDDDVRKSQDLEVDLAREGRDHRVRRPGAENPYEPE